MAHFKVQGGKQLKGEIVPQGAKNEALQVISAVLLSSEEVVISNVPQIRDVLKLIDLLESMGVEVKKLNDDTYSFKASNIDLEYFLSDQFKEQGASLRGVYYDSRSIAGSIRKSFYT